MIGVLVIAAVFAVVGFRTAMLLTSIFERKQEARNPYVRLVEVTEETTDSAPWGMNWPREYDDYLRTSEVTRTTFGGSEALPRREDRARPVAEADVRRLRVRHRLPRPPRARVHALGPGDDRRVTERRSRARACTATRRSSRPTGAWAKATSSRDSRRLGKMLYADAHAEVVKTGSSNPVAGGTGDAVRAHGGRASGGRASIATIPERWSCA